MAPFAVENIVLIVYLWEQLDQALILTWYLSVCSAIVCVLKWRTIWRYLLRFKCISFLTICSGITAVVMYCIAVRQWYNDIYIKYHSLWHCFVFSTAGFGCTWKAEQIKIKVPEKLEDYAFRDDDDVGLHTKKCRNQSIVCSRSYTT